MYQLCSATNHADAGQKTQDHVYVKHQNEEKVWSVWLWAWHGCRCHMGWCEYSRNWWYPWIFTHSRVSRVWRIFRVFQLSSSFTWGWRLSRSVWESGGCASQVSSVCVCVWVNELLDKYLSLCWAPKAAAAAAYCTCSVSPPFSFSVSSGTKGHHEPIW